MNDFRREIDYTCLGLLDAYPLMPVNQARALVRAARSYQEAIWAADSDPRQAWLRLVTAVEVVAELQPKRPAEERLRAVYPEMADQILRCGDPELKEWIMSKIADRERVQARFLDFLKEHQPPRPPRRPKAPSERQDWRTLQQQLRTIYQARSNDLHKGTPVPKVMCEPPYVSRSRIAEEVTYSSSAEGRRLRLHVFEYIVRQALLSWWRSIGAAHSR